jgi:hypothetical protein
MRTVRRYTQGRPRRYFRADLEPAEKLLGLWILKLSLDGHDGGSYIGKLEGYTAWFELSKIGSRLTSSENPSLQLFNPEVEPAVG